MLLRTRSANKESGLLYLCTGTGTSGFIGFIRNEALECKLTYKVKNRSQPTAASLL